MGVKKLVSSFLLTGVLAIASLQTGGGMVFAEDTVTSSEPIEHEPVPANYSEAQIQEMESAAAAETDYARNNWDQYSNEQMDPTAQKIDEPEAASGTANFTKGDILVTMDNGSSSFRYGHAAIVLSDNRYTMEAWPSNGVQIHGISKWRPGGSIKTMIAMWVKGALGEDYTESQYWAKLQKGDPYNSSFYDSNRTDKFYCSQLVWKAWKYAGFDVNGGWDSLISPFDMVEDSQTTGYYTR